MGTGWKEAMAMAIGRKWCGHWPNFP